MTMNSGILIRRIARPQPEAAPTPTHRRPAKLPAHLILHHQAGLRQDVQAGMWIAWTCSSDSICSTGAS